MKKRLIRLVNGKKINVILTDAFIFDLTTPYIICENADVANSIFDIIPDYWLQLDEEPAYFKAEDLHRGERYSLYSMLRDLLKRDFINLDADPIFHLDEKEEYQTFDDYSTEDDWACVEDEITFDDYSIEEEGDPDDFDDEDNTKGCEDSHDKCSKKSHKGRCKGSSKGSCKGSCNGSCKGSAKGSS